MDIWTYSMYPFFLSANITLHFSPLQTPVFVFDPVRCQLPYQLTPRKCQVKLRYSLVLGWIGGQKLACQVISHCHIVECLPFWERALRAPLWMCFFLDWVDCILWFGCSHGLSCSHVKLKSYGGPTQQKFGWKCCIHLQLALGFLFRHILAVNLLRLLSMGIV